MLFNTNYEFVNLKLIFKYEISFKIININVFYIKTILKKDFKVAFV